MIDDSSLQNGRTTSKEQVGRPPRRGHAAEPPLARRSRELVRLIKSLEGKSGPREVHRLRTTIRRVETLMPSDAGASGVERKIQKQLDRIRKRAGKVRDLDVHLKALRSLPRTVAADGRADLAGALRRSRQRRQKRLLRVIGNERDRGIVRRLRRAVAAAPSVPHPDAAGMERDLGRVLADFATAYDRAQPLTGETLHAFRIATKRLRYRAETLTPHPLAAALVAELKRTQDAIGTWHDWVTLAERAKKALGDDGDARVLSDALRARVDAYLVKALAVTTRVARRLAKLSAGLRKGVQRMTPPPVEALARIAPTSA